MKSSVGVPTEGLVAWYRKEKFFFHGAIDEVRLYGRALTAAEIHSLCTEGGWAPT